ncbi:MAG: roadblock/LC7 domain-containing protein [Candidatus Woesearchaeota archaeon]
MKTDKSHILDIIKNLRQKVDDIEGCAVISKDGLLIASDLRANTDSGVLAAMGAEIAKSRGIVMSELKMGDPLQVILNSTKGEIIVSNVGKRAVLVCLLKLKANLGMVLFHMNRAGGHIIPFIK